MKGQEQSDFATLLDDLMAAARERELEEPVTEPALRVDLLAQIDRLHAASTATRAQATQAYRDQTGYDLPPRGGVSLEPALEDLFYLDPGSIARELGIEKRRTAAELDQARRLFAMRYHPDRVPEEMRERAKMRMQIANMLIDDAKRGKR